jgi:hypothetical protein
VKLIDKFVFETVPACRSGEDAPLRMIKMMERSDSTNLQSSIFSSPYFLREK